MNTSSLSSKYFLIYVFIRVLLVVVIFLISSFIIFCVFHETIEQARVTATFDYMEENNIYEILRGVDDFYIRQYIEWIGHGFRADCGLYAGY